MANGISFSMITDPFKTAIASREARMPRAAMFAVREAGRAVKRAAQAKAPVLKDPSTLSHAKLQRYRKAGFNVKAAYDKPVPGLYKASISSSKRMKQFGTSVYSVTVGPRGQRVHLYAQKVEARYGPMAAGHKAAEVAMLAIATKAFNKVWAE